MAISGSDLISPKGEISLDLFPDDTEIELSERLDTFILEAEGKKAGISEVAKQAWAYYRAFRQVFIYLSSHPSARFDDQGEVRYSDAQIQNFNTLAEKYKIEWDNAVSGTDSSNRILSNSTSVANKFTW